MRLSLKTKMLTLRGVQYIYIHGKMFCFFGCKLLDVSRRRQKISIGNEVIVN